VEPPDYDQWDVRRRVRAHVSALQQQHQQFWQAAALAVALERILVLPKFRCFCDETWPYVMEQPSRVGCRFPGAWRQPLPFYCPQDSVLNILNLNDIPEKFGPVVQYRESTFLDNPRTPSEVKEDKVTVAFDLLSEPSKFGLSSKKAVEAQVHLPADIGEEALRKRLAAYTETRVVHFKTIGNFLSHNQTMWAKRRSHCTLENQKALMFVQLQAAQ
jgi:hypothetical protein